MSIIERLTQDAARKAEAQQRRQTKANEAAESAFWSIVGAEVRGEDVAAAPGEILATCATLGFEVDRVEETVELIRYAIGLYQKYGPAALAARTESDDVRGRELQAVVQQAEAQLKEARRELAVMRSAAAYYRDDARDHQRKLREAATSLALRGVRLDPGTLPPDLEQQVADAMPSPEDPTRTVAEQRRAAELQRSREDAAADAEQRNAEAAARYSGTPPLGHDMLRGPVR